MSSVGVTPVSSVGVTPVSSVGATPVSSVGVTLPVSCVSPPSDSPPPPVPPRALQAVRASKATSQPYAQTGARLIPCTDRSIAGRAVARAPARRTLGARLSKVGAAEAITIFFFCEESRRFTLSCRVPGGNSRGRGLDNPPSCPTAPEV